MKKTDGTGSPAGGIGQLNERSLHRSLKAIYRKDGTTEADIGGYIVDILSRDGEIIEIQTKNLAAMRNKLAALLPSHRVRVIHPVAAETIIVLHDEEGGIRRRKSPKRGSVESAAEELLYLEKLLPEPNLTVEIVLIRQQELRTADGKGARRRRGVSINDRRLIEVIGSVRFSETGDYLKLLPPELPPLFGNREIADTLTAVDKAGRLRLAGRLSWLLRKLGLIEVHGKEGRRLIFKLSSRT